METLYPTPYYLITNVYGHSMWPDIPQWSVIVIQRSGFDSLQVGQDVVYVDSEGDLVVHRILEPVGVGFKVQGTNNDLPDGELVYLDNYVGRVVVVFRP